MPNVGINPSDLILHVDANEAFENVLLGWVYFGSLGVVSFEDFSVALEHGVVLQNRIFVEAEPVLLHLFLFCVRLQLL